MQTWHFKSQKQYLGRLAGSVVVATLALTSATSQGGLFTGEFAPSQWVFTGDPGATLEWLPSVALPESARIEAAPGITGGIGSITTFSLLPVYGDYVVTFRTTFVAGTSLDAALYMTVPGNPNPILLGQSGDPMPVINNINVNIGPGNSIAFAMFGNTPSDKKDVPYFIIEEWDVQVIPEASTWIAGLGLLSLCGFQLWRSRRGNRSEAVSATA